MAELDKSEISLLRKGMNFAVTPKNVPVKEIITAVVQGISKLPRDVKGKVRSDVCSILKHAKPPKVTNICPDERQAVRNLKENDEILVLPADKGNATIVMNKYDYKKQISSMLEDTKTYTPVTDKRRNPTSSTANSLQKKLGELKKSGNLTGSEYFKIKPNDPVPAAFYGLPKFHKIKLSAKDDHYTVADPSEPIPLRPINSCIGSPTYQVSRYLADLLKPLCSDSNCTVKNSKEFTEFIRTQTVQPDEEILSLDVVSLFTSIPVDLALEVIDHRLESNPIWQENTNLTKDQVVELTRYVLKNSYFYYEGTMYHQTFGCAMGSPVSAIIAELVMGHVEAKALSTFPDGGKGMSTIPIAASNPMIWRISTVI